MKRKMMTVLSMLAVIFFVGCGGGSSNTPEGIAEEYVRALYEGDMNTMKKLNPEAIKADEEKQTEQFLAAIKEKVDSDGGIKTLTSEAPKINEEGTEAKVKVTVTFGNGKEESLPVTLKKEGSKWVFDKIKLF
jgi:ABC-type phosphate/phosphonate transport system substrate-binding protein